MFDLNFRFGIIIIKINKGDASMKRNIAKFTILMAVIISVLLSGCGKTTEIIDTPKPEEATPEQIAETPTEIATTEATAKPKKEFSFTQIAGFDNRSGSLVINGDDGWNFGSDDYNSEFTDGVLKITDVGSGIMVVRLNLGTFIIDGFDSHDCELTDSMEAVGFYFENNSEETVGLAYFGEIRLPGVESCHQQFYLNTDFVELTCYLVDLDGNYTLCDEYVDNGSAFLRGLAEVPEGFKGYFVCTFESMGHDRCFYADWGYHDVNTCLNGEYVKGATIANIGFSLAVNEPDEDANYIIGDYYLVNIDN